jgi:hypothetical protein
LTAWGRGCRLALDRWGRLTHRDQRGPTDDGRFSATSSTLSARATILIRTGDARSVPENVHLEIEMTCYLVGMRPCARFGHHVEGVPSGVRALGGVSASRRLIGPCPPSAGGRGGTGRDRPGFLGASSLDHPSSAFGSSTRESACEGPRGSRQGWPGPRCLSFEFERRRQAPDAGCERPEAGGRSGDEIRGCGPAGSGIRHLANALLQAALEECSWRGLSTVGTERQRGRRRSGLGLDLLLSLDGAEPGGKPVEIGT